MHHSKNYVLVDDKLYKRGAGSGILMKCITAEEGKEILHEAHEGTCRNHAASRTLVSKVFRSGFYWRTELSDAELLDKWCPGCQYFTKQSHLPAHNLITIPPSWPFACWSLDMIGPLPTAPGGFTHILVAVDKFTKWIEVKPITKISLDHAVKFISEILHRFGFPNTIIIDLVSNFTSQDFWDYCEDSSIDVKYVSVAHPRANGQVEHINGLIIDGLKKRIFYSTSKKGGKWLAELPMVI